MKQLPVIQSMGSKQKPAIMSFSQLNRGEAIQDHELSNGSNLNSDLFPVLTQRPSREIVQTIANPHGIFSANGKLCYVSGTDFYYDGVIKGTVTAGLKSFTIFQKKVIIMPDRKYYDFGTDVFGSISSSPIDYAVTYLNRIFGVQGINLYASALGLYDAWDTFAGENTDSYATTASTNGDFNALVSYQNHVVAFKPQKMYELYGSYPSQYSLQDVCEVGCLDYRSIAEVNNRLYFLGDQGVVMEYSGGLPRPISDSLNDKFVEGAGATDGKKYYLSAKNAAGVWKLYVYDTWRGTWLPEDDLSVMQFTAIDNVVYALAADGKIIKFKSGAEAINWSMTTRFFDDNTFGHKEICGIILKADLSAGSTASIYLKVDDDPFVLIRTVAAASYQNHEIPFMVQRGKRYQLRFDVSGPGKIYGMQRQFVIGGDV